MNVTICGIDPGKTTGVAVINFDGSLSGRRLVMSNEVPFEEAPVFFEGLLPTVDVIAMEKFLIMPSTISKSRQYEALYVIGGVIFLASLAGDIPIIMQRAADAKTAYGALPVEVGHIQPKFGHARDALRHALLATHKRDLYSEVKTET